MVRITTVTLLEFSYSARGPGVCRRADNSPLSSMLAEYLASAIEDRAVKVLAALAERGRHRGPSIPDLLVGVVAELAASRCCRWTRTSI